MHEELIGKIQLSSMFEYYVLSIQGSPTASFNLRKESPTFNSLSPSPLLHSGPDSFRHVVKRTRQNSKILNTLPFSAKGKNIIREPR
jgi:hypothetical protein